jgi:predicted alternative tryptophan synthase beta-subunit
MQAAKASSTAIEAGESSAIGKCLQFTKGELSYDLTDTNRVSPSLEVIGAHLTG